MQPGYIPSLFDMLINYSPDNNSICFKEATVEVQLAVAANSNALHGRRHPRKGERQRNYHAAVVAHTGAELNGTRFRGNRLEGRGGLELNA